MKVSYPHMGYLSIPVFNMLTNLGVEVVEAPAITKKTLELGSLYSPEGVCLPYKINMGNFLESIDKGADTFVTVCGAGKCRLGFYNAVQKIQLSKTKDVGFYTIDTNHLFTSLYHFLQTVAPQASRLEIVKQITMAIKTLKALDAINNAKNFYGSRSNTPDAIIDIANNSARAFTHCQALRDIKDKQDTIIQLIRPMSEDTASETPKIGLVGEFYMLLEPYVNYRIEDVLIKRGIEVKKFVNTGAWVYSNTLLSSLGLYNEEKAYQKQASPYLNHHVGGDGLKSVGTTLWCARNGYDGIIHVYPFGCMPEIVAQYALKNIAHDFNLPLLSLSVDEHSSDVGVLTRLEAFVDCIKRKNSANKTASYSL
ncbi:hypothetical protein [Sporomusa malonica]|uniref:Predicted nucleotide-binding protein, sugar kinase/HSP70/actin superfamily n=2 Tax=Sporomusa malonica TaxID=112901 RepID=A0A1W1Y7T3_9FIRM|nr:Predicted nucleotide-binding protein, sugar kinase/HSP70/actin superfamily [Sporomusa malonica]